MYYLVLFLALISTAFGQAVLNVHNDLGGTGATTTETQLTPTSVVAGKFGLLGYYTVDDDVFGQILYAPAISIGGTIHDIVLIVTVNNSLYAFDANVPGSTYLWKVNFGAPNTSYAGQGSPNQFYQKGLGCWGTPAIDPVSAVAYLACGTTTATWVLRKINLSDGSTAGSVTITGSVAGTGDPGGGDCVSGSVLSFCPAREFQRPGIKLSQGLIYVAFGGIGDVRPYHGWIMAYNSSLVQQGIFCTTPSGWGGAIWGGEPTFDSAGHVFITTGNGTDQTSGIWTNSVLALTSTLALLGSWTPANAVTINADDADTSANRIIVLPSGALAATGSKDFNVYILDVNCLLGGGAGTTCQDQAFKTNGSGTITSFSGAYGATFMSSVLFLPTTAGSIYAFTCTGSGATACNSTPLFMQTNSYGFPGPAQMSGSSNGGLSTILWITTAGSSTFTAPNIPGVLRALNPLTGAEYWNSGSSLGNIAKFAAPTVAGKVWVAAQNGSIPIYGLLTPNIDVGQTTSAGQTQ